MSVLITGATGLIGQAIVKQCHAQNIAVNYLSTHKSKLESSELYKGFYWNPKQTEIDTACFHDVSVIINLAGAPIAKRWTYKHKRTVLESRLDALRLLKEGLKNQSHTVKHLISASAIGVYPNSLTHYYDEDFKDFETGYLSNVVQQWEYQASQFDQLGINVSIVRIGMVLAKHGGALSAMANPIKWFLGSALGTGNQWQSWIHIEDVALLFIYLLKEEESGVFNAVAPNAVTQQELVRDLAKVLKRPIILPNAPSFVLRLLLGEMSTLVLESQRVSAKKIEDLGFTFKFHHLRPALEDLLLDDKEKYKSPTNT